MNNRISINTLAIFSHCINVSNRMAHYFQQIDTSPVDCFLSSPSWKHLKISAPCNLQIKCSHCCSVTTRPRTLSKYPFNHCTPSPTEKHWSNLHNHRHLHRTFIPVRKSRINEFQYSVALYSVGVILAGFCFFSQTCLSSASRFSTEYYTCFLI